MAEAHSAVAFSFTITHEGVNVNFDWEVVHLVFSSAARSSRKRLARFKNSINNGVYPASPQSLYIVITFILALYYAGWDVSRGIIPWMESHIPGEYLAPTAAFAFSCAVFGLLIWIGFILFMRYLLKFLFMYKGWMYEPRGGGKPMSLKSKLWLLLVKILSARKPQLYSFQGSIPSLPVPSLDHTMNAYLRSVRPLLDDEKYNRMAKLADEFKKGIAKKLQRYLVLKSWFTSNYVSDWWEEYVYLRSRTPLMVNSNFYGIDALMIHPTKLQAARAGCLAHLCLQFRRLIERQELEPIMVQGIVPLCSWQYERVFNTTRVPGVETDKVVHYTDSNHIAVHHGGCWFKVIIYHRGRMLSPCEIEIQMQKILDGTHSPAKGEQFLGALTASDRVTWANARNQYFGKGINKASLDIIEKAAFVLVLEDDDYEYDPKHPEKLDRFGRMLLHGKGYDRWFDKSMNLIIAKNGKVGFNAEHSWGDAAIISHLWECVMMGEYLVKRADAPVMGHLWEHFMVKESGGSTNQPSRYTEDGHCKGTPEFEPPEPIRLKWDLSIETLDLITSSVQKAELLLSDVDLRIFVHDTYGKGFMKTCKVSPDAYIQMALQLAYYRDAGRFCLTYEASMTRLFREGRTETVRPCTIESSQWVKAMEDGNIPVSDKISLFRKGCGFHQRSYQDAMCGLGIDRHLFCLYVISKYLEIDSPFLKEVLSEPWRLSTSQTPHGQTNQLDLKKNPECISAGGGFGPVADDGYGVSYIIAGEDVIFFHISSKRSSPETDSSRFARQIDRALQDIKKLFER
ncbi:hypothetical protein CHUAL_000246 [Chamberlinius hualienensis]